MAQNSPTKNFSPFPNTNTVPSFGNIVPLSETFVLNYYPNSFGRVVNIILFHFETFFFNEFEFRQF